MSQQLELLTENPSQWNSVIQITPEIQKKQIKPFVALAVKELAGAPDGRLASLARADQYAAVRAVLAHAARLRSAAREPWRLTDVTTFLESLRFPAECAEELARLVCAEQLYAQLPSHRRHRPSLTALHWNIDVSMRQSAGRWGVFVILRVGLSDDSSHTYRLSLSQFHELRFVVASALKSMLVLQRRKCMRQD